MTSPRILLVEDDVLAARATARLAVAAGFQVQHARTVAEAKVRLREGIPDVVVTDYHLPDGTGVQVQGLVNEIALQRRSRTPYLIGHSAAWRQLEKLEGVRVLKGDPGALKKVLAKATEWYHGASVSSERTP